MSSQEAGELGVVQRQIESYIGHWLWDPLIQWILMAPTWVVFGIMGALFVYLGRRRRSYA